MSESPQDGPDADPASQALAIARELRTVIRDIAGRLGDTDAYARRTRKLARRARWTQWLLAVALAGTVVLSVVTAVLLRGQGAALFRNCTTGNDLRGGQLRVWDYVLGLSVAPPGETAHERAVRLRSLTAFQVYINRQFRPVDCRKLYGG